MANMIIDLKGDNGQLPPAAVELIRQGAFYVPPSLRYAYCGTPEGLLSIPDVINEDAEWHGLPIAANLPADNFEVLVRTIRLTKGIINWNNGGGGIALTQDYLAGDIANILQTPMYYINYGSGGSTSIYSCYLRDTPNPQTFLDSNSVTGVYSLDKPIISYMRIRRNGAMIQVKAWNEGASEPTAWQLNISNSKRSVSHVFLLTLHQTAILYTDIAIATNGDTAIFDVPGITITGTTNHTGHAYPVQVLDYETHMHLGSGWTDPLTGEWSVEVFSDGKVYARVDGPNGPEYDYQFAAGDGLLSGSFPLSMLTSEGNLPSQAEIRILYRPNTGDPGDGYVVATTTCNADGTWQVSGLNENLKFDIVARIPGFNDVIISDVQPTGAPLTAHFVGIKEEYEYGEEVSIQVVALGGRPPYVFEAVSLPDGLSMDSAGNITGNIVSTLDVSFNVTVTDSDSTVITLSADSYVHSDPHWDKVVALLHFDGPNGSTTVVEEKGIPMTVTRGTPSVSNAEFKFGGASWHTTDGRITSPLLSSLPFGVEDFTVEAFIMPTNLGARNEQIIVCMRNQPTANGQIVALQNGRLGFSNGSTWRIGDTSLSENMWSHIAVSREASVLRLFVNGVLDGQWADNTNFTGSRILSIGDFESSHFGAFVGYIDELRITKGIARYTENFTPPTAPFPNY